ncbi:hypothetical protein MKW94_003548, partial [Papaver nudicaule]|nr:hypothetical protein [Papaver nudicaule]
IFDIANFSSTSFPTFDNLKHLQVNCYQNTLSPRPSIRSLFNFLRSSPKLESLVINKVHFSHKPNGNMFRRYGIPQCLLLCLKSIEFRNFNGFPEEIELVKFLLKHARVLKLVTIRSEFSSDVELDDFSNEGILEKLLKFPKASTHCRFQAFETKRT